VDLDSDNPLAAEIRQEMAQAYFASCKKMVAALDALKKFDHETSNSQQNSNHSHHRSELLQAAGERVYFVIIQREAMKLPWHDSFFESYDIPEELKTHIGPYPGKAT
jgi:hypothetical protein